MFLTSWQTSITAEMSEIKDQLSAIRFGSDEEN